MSFRAGPVRSNRRQVRQQPYGRPARPGAAVAAPAERAQRAEQAPSLFSRIKRFFRGAPAPEAPRVSEPPRLLGEDETEFEPQAEASQEASQFADIDCDTSTGSRIVHTSQSLGSLTPEPTPAVADGPNEALRQFFETKGDDELSNMEVVGVLSLIGQAVGRNESLVDFSQLSMDQQSDIDATASDASVLRGLHVPPSPQLYRKGTPPPSARRAVDRSPWNSTPRRSSIRSRYSLATAPPRRGSPSAGPSPARPSGLRNSLARDSGPGAWPSRAEQSRVTPAASAILQALDNESPPKKPVLASQRPSRISTSYAEDAGDAPGFSFAFASQPATKTPPAAAAAKRFERVPASLLGGDAARKASPPQASPPQASTLQASTLQTSTPQASTLQTSTPQASEPKRNEPKRNEPKANESRFGKTELEPKFNGVSTQNDGRLGSNDVEAKQADEADKMDAAFAFDIPLSSAPRELTPAEEAIVAETQSEFTF